MWLQLNVPNLVDDHYLLQDPTYDNTSMFYGLPQYHQYHPTNYYVPYVAFQAKPPSQLPSSSSHGVSSDHFWITHGELIKEKHIRNTHESSVLSTFGGTRNIPRAVIPPPHLPNRFI